MLVLALIVGLWSVPALADATAQDKASAEALFDRGVKLMHAGKFEEACPKLEDSQRIDPGVGTLLYLGECYEKLGRPASAWATFREAASSAEASGQARRAGLARQRIAKLEPDLAYLTLDVAEATRGLEGLTVVRDGVDVGAGIVGAAVPVDPGTTTIEVSAPGYQPYTVTVTVSPKSKQSLLIPVLVALPKPPPEPEVAPLPPPTPEGTQPPLPSPAPPPERGAHPLTVAGIAVAAAGVVGLGIGTYFGVKAINEDKKADDGTCDATVCQAQADYDHSQNARKAATAANVAIGIGAGLFVAGGVLFFLAPSSDEKDTGSLRIGPTFGPGMAGVLVKGRL